MTSYHQFVHDSVPLQLCNSLLPICRDEVEEFGLTRHDSAHGPTGKRKFGVNLVSNTANLAGFADSADL